MHITEKKFRNTEIRATLRERLADYLYRAHTHRTADRVCRDVQSATGQHIPSSTISKWLYRECSPSPERQALLESTYPGITAFMHRPFREAIVARKERELEQRIQIARQGLQAAQQELAALRAG